MNEPRSDYISNLGPENLVPTRARWVVMAFLFSLMVILYIDRICISKAAPLIEESLGITHTRMGIIFAAFTVAYGLFEIPAGRWGDKHGSRGVLARIVLWWSVFTILTGCVRQFSWIPGILDSFTLMLAVRFLFGAGEAGALPNTARVSARWFSLEERSLVQGFIVTGMSIGGAVSPIVAGLLIENVGWRLSFVIFGSLGFVWTAFFYSWFRDDPAQHPSVNAAELLIISRGKKKEEPSDAHPAVPWGAVLTSANAWVMGGIMTACAFSSYLFMFWYPTYLEKGLGVSPENSKWLASMALVGASLGCFIGGFLAKWAGEGPWGAKWGRRWLGFISLALGAICLYVSVTMRSPVAAAGCAGLVGLTAFCQQANWWAAVTETSGRHLGALFGLLNSLGVPGAMGSQLFMGWFADYRKAAGFVGREQWDPAFYVYSGVLAVGAILWLLVDVEKPMIPEDAASHKAIHDQSSVSATTLASESV